MPKITSLNRLAAKQGFRAGDDVVSLGGYEMRDILDYLYFDNEKPLRRKFCETARNIP